MFGCPCGVPTSASEPLYPGSRGRDGGTVAAHLRDAQQVSPRQGTRDKVNDDPG